MKARYYRTSRTQVEEVELEKKLTLTEMQEAVGGYIILAPRPDGTPFPRRKRKGGWTMIVNEDGMPKGLPFNPVASLVMGYEIYGDAVEIDYPFS